MTPDATPNPQGPFAGRAIHFVGIGGCGMSGLAAFVLNEGARVSGSDVRAGAVTQRLACLGATVHVGHAAENVPPEADTLVASAAVQGDNPELVEAHRRDIRVEKYAVFLGRLMALREGIAVSGTHGKSTTTAMLAFVLREAGLDPSFVVGADVPQLGGGSRAGQGRHFVAEACEFDRSFHNLSPRAAAVLNVDEDHLDCFPGGIAEIRAAFRTFASRVAPDGLLIVNGADPDTADAARGLERPVTTFGMGGAYDWRAENLEEHTGCYAFDVYRGADVYARMQLSLPGRHNVLNALAAAALADWAGAEAEDVAGALGRFAGCRRRMEVLGTAGGVTVVDDYAHHPNEIVATLKAARERFKPNRLWVVFQPHQHSRTRFLLKDFALALLHADKVIVPDIYFVRDSEVERQQVHSRHLVGQMEGRGDALYMKDFESIRRYLTESLEPGDVLLVMGAGDIGRIAPPLMANLAARAASSDRAAAPGARTENGHLQGT